MWPQETLHAATATTATSRDVDASTAASTRKDGMNTPGGRGFRRVFWKDNEYLVKDVGEY